MSLALKLFELKAERAIASRDAPILGVSYPRSEPSRRNGPAGLSCPQGWTFNHEGKLVKYDDEA